MAQSNARIYIINIYQQAQWLLHVRLRLAKWIVFLKALVYPLIYVLNLFALFRTAKLYQLMITGQVCYLEMMLNDAYDSTLRRITIEDAVWHLPLFLYQEAESKPVDLFQESENEPVYLYTEGEAGVALNDFVVLVPAGILFSEAQMSSMIDNYKIFGTSYSIQTT